MIGLTIMEISAEEMHAVVQYYLNHNLLNATFQAHHESVVEDVRQRSNGRFVIEFREQKKTVVKSVAEAASEV